MNLIFEKSEAPSGVMKRSKKKNVNKQYFWILSIKFEWKVGENGLHSHPGSSDWRGADAYGEIFKVEEEGEEKLNILSFSKFFW